MTGAFHEWSQSLIDLLKTFADMGAACGPADSTCGPADWTVDEPDVNEDEPDPVEPDAQAPIPDPIPDPVPLPILAPILVPRRTKSLRVALKKSLPRTRSGKW